VEHALDVWPAIGDLLSNNHVILLLDFDGTLAPIVREPGKAALPARTRAVLEKLSGKESHTVAIVSGRSLADLRNKVGIEDLIYVGNHGIEIAGPGLSFIAPGAPSARSALMNVKAAVCSFASGIHGVLFEDKGASLSVHVRMVREAEKAAVLDGVQSAARPFLDILNVRMGKEVVDITPLGWDKGNAVRWLLDRIIPTLPGASAVPVCIGDDATDEDAFRAVNGRGVTVVVGERARSSARYYLNDTASVRRFLQKTLDLGA
jgi:trehalose-phosphatase